MTVVDGHHSNLGSALAPIDLRCTATVRRSRFAPMMSSKQTILDRELFTQALRHMGEEDLLSVGNCGSSTKRVSAAQRLRLTSRQPETTTMN